MLEDKSLSVQQVLSPREYTRQQDQSGRDDLAEKIVGLRSEYFTQQQEISSGIKEIQQKLEPIYEKIRELEDELTEVHRKKIRQNVSSWNTISMALVKRDFALERLEKQEQKIKKAIDAEHDKAYPLNRDKRALEEQQKDKGKLEEAVAKRAEYYEEADRYTLSKEHIQSLFTEETLGQLTTEQYMRLWSKAHPYFVSHVTRHGFRDHAAMMYHQGGMGQFADGFQDCLNDERRLQSPMHVRSLNDFGVESIRAWMEEMGVFEMATKEEALKRLHDMLHFTIASAPHYPDKIAVHFGVESVLDAYYGGETANEIFYIFPADFVASQTTFAFNGWEKTFKEPQSEAKWNDLFVWFEDGNGAGLDAGLVFIPSDTQVDPETGSKYGSEEVDVDGVKQREMVIDSQASEKLKVWLGENFLAIKELWGDYQVPRKYGEQERARERLYAEVVKRLQTLGLVEAEAWRGLESVLQLFYFGRGYESPIEIDEETLEHMIDSLGIRNKKPDTTVSAQEFWESYFVKHPSSKPKHVIYYTGSPTVAVRTFLAEHGVKRAKNSPDDELLSFSENHVEDMENDPRANRGYDEISSKAKALIDEVFP